MNNKIADQLLKSAQEQQTNLEEFVANASVSAAHMQTAANAIVSLTGSLGSIYNMVSAADFDGELCVQVEAANNMLNTIAYKAEQLCKNAMEASVATSKLDSISGIDHMENIIDGFTKLPA